MRKNMKYSKENLSIKEREKLLNNFYTKQMKKGKTNRAVMLDKIALGLGGFFILAILAIRLTRNIFAGLIISVLICIPIGIYGTRLSLKFRDRRIQEFKKQYKAKLEEEKLLPIGEDLEDYILERYYNKKNEFKSNIKYLSKDKIFKFYLLFIILYIISFFVSYHLYYKIMAIISFVIATVIGSYNITEYIRKKDNMDLLNKDIDV